MRGSTGGAVILVLTACTSGDGSFRKRPGTTDDSGSPTGSTTGTTGGTTSTGTTTTTTTFDCDSQPAPPLNLTSYPIHTEEDFDFADDGLLVYQSGLQVVGTDKTGETRVLAPGAAGDPRGVHGLSDGRIVIMSPWDGAIKVADPSNGSLSVLTSALNTPNGVDVGEDDRIYFTTYGEIGWTDPEATEYQVFYSWPGAGGYLSPNGTVLSNDEQQITVAVPTNWSDTQFFTFDRLGPDDWGNPQVLYDVNGFYSGLDQDVCGNLYTVEYYSGRVIRVDPDGNAELVIDLESSGGWAFSAVRFGPGQGGWDRDHLYVTSRGSKIWDIEIGIPGRRHPTTP